MGVTALRPLPGPPCTSAVVRISEKPQAGKAGKSSPSPEPPASPVGAAMGPGAEPGSLWARLEATAEGQTTGTRAWGSGG